MSALNSFFWCLLTGLRCPSHNRQFCKQRWIDWRPGLLLMLLLLLLLAPLIGAANFRMRMVMGVLEWDEFNDGCDGVAAAAAVATYVSYSYRPTNIAIIESASKTMKKATSYTRMDKFYTTNVYTYVTLSFPFARRIILPLLKFPSLVCLA